MSNINALKSVVNFGDQTITVSFYVEDSPSVHRVGTSKRFSNIRQTLPRGSLGNSKPNVQWGLEIAVTNGSFLKLLAADDVHDLTVQFRIMRSSV